MSDTQLTEEQRQSRRSMGRWLAIGGWFFLFFGIYLSAFLIPDTARSIKGPQVLNLSQAAETANAERTYAELEDGTWDCATLTPVEGLSPSHRRYTVLEENVKTTEIFYTDEAQDVVVFVTLSGEVSCDDLADEQPSGYLYTMSSDTRTELTRAARLSRYTDAEAYLEFCGYCGFDNSLIGSIFGVAFLLAGLAMIFSGRNIRRAHREPGLDS